LAIAAAQFSVGKGKVSVNVGWVTLGDLSPKPPKKVAVG
jgi:hypothetical protein